MERKQKHLEIFHRVIREGAFPLLESYEDVDGWPKMSDEERDLLGLLFAWRGDRQLLRGSAEEAERSFALATSVAPRSADVCYWQGVAWMKQRELERASHQFAQAIERSATHGLAWQDWGVALAHQGRFAEAQEKFREAEPHIAERGKLYWEWGRAHFLEGRSSEEAVDLRVAIERFVLAEREGLDTAAFWLDYGQALATLGHLVGDPALLTQSLPCISRAVEQERDSFAGWLALGRAFKRLFEISSGEEHYLRAYDCFERAARLKGATDLVWLDWAELLALEGERRGAASYLEEALEKLKELGHERLEEAPVAALAIRALLRLGLILERLDLLREAEQRAHSGVIAYPTSGLLWCRLGDCCYAQGVYFSDAEYFREAADKYAYALTLEKGLSAAHIGLAQASFGIGNLRNDPSYLEKAAQRCGLVAGRDKLSANAWHLWGLSLLRLAEHYQDRQQALEAVERLGRALMLRGGIENSTEIDWLLDYGSALDLLACLAEEESYARQALQVLSRLHYLQPDDLEIRFRLGSAWLHLGEAVSDVDYFRRAMEHFESLAIRDPDDDLVWDEWGCALLGLSRLLEDPAHPGQAARLRSDAEAKFKRAVGLGCDEALYHLAWINAQAARDEEATHFLRQAAQQGSLPSLEILLHDDWLAPIRESELFRAFLRETDEEQE